MSEELKCPCCGSEASDFEQTGVVECEECQFMCDIKDFPHIAAAMELAKFTVQMKTCRAYCPERAYLSAQDRVLEVFK